jgi:hypothetical protein
MRIARARPFRGFRQGQKSRFRRRALESAHQRIGPSLAIAGRVMQ